MDVSPDLHIFNNRGRKVSMLSVVFSLLAKTLIPFLVSPINSTSEICSWVLLTSTFTSPWISSIKITLADKITRELMVMIVSTISLREWRQDSSLCFHKDPEQRYKERKCPFPSSEAFHNSFPISMFSENKKNLHVLHDNWRREFYLGADGTQLFTAAFPLRDICSEGFPAIFFYHYLLSVTSSKCYLLLHYLLSATSIPSNTPNYINLKSTLDKRYIIPHNGNVITGSKM